MRSTRLTQGFSTLELLVATAILGIVTSQILSVIGTQQRNFVVHQDVLEAQEDTRLVTDMMITDIRMAGFMLPEEIGIASLDGGTSNADRICVSDANGINPGSLGTVNGRFPGARISSALGASGATVNLVPASMDIDGDTTVDFAVGSGIILSDGARSYCGRITALNAGTGAVAITPPAPGGGFTMGTLLTRAAPAVIYEVGVDGLRRNSLLFSSQIEDIQIEYTVDGAFPVHSLDGSQPDAVSTVRLSVIARTDRDDLNQIAGLRPAVANRDAGAADMFRRRLFTSTIAPRNFQ